MPYIKKSNIASFSFQFQSSKLPLSNRASLFDLIAKFLPKFYERDSTQK